MANSRDEALGTVLRRWPAGGDRDQLRDYLALKVAAPGAVAFSGKPPPTSRQKELANNSLYKRSKAPFIGKVLGDNAIDQFGSISDRVEYIDSAEYKNTKAGFGEPPEFGPRHPQFSTASMHNRFNRYNYSALRSDQTPWDPVPDQQPGFKAEYPWNVRRPSRSRYVEDNVGQMEYYWDEDLDRDAILQVQRGQAGLEYSYDQPQREYRKMGAEIAQNPSTENYRRMADALREGGSIV